MFFHPVTFTFLSQNILSTFRSQKPPICDLVMILLICMNISLPWTAHNIMKSFSVFPASYPKKMAPRPNGRHLQ